MKRGEPWWLRCGGSLTPQGLGDCLALYGAGEVAPAGNDILRPSWGAPDIADGSFSQVTTGFRPVLTANRGDGRPCLAWDGVDDRLSNLSDIPAAWDRSGAAIVACCYIPNTTGRPLGLFKTNGVTANKAEDLYHPGSGGNVYGTIAAGAPSCVVNGAVGWKTVVLTHDGTNATLRVNGVQQVKPVAALSAFQPDRMFLGCVLSAAGSPVNFSAWKLSALWLYRSPVNAAKAEALMQKKWGYI